MNEIIFSLVDFLALAMTKITRDYSNNDEYIYQYLQ